MGEYIVAVGVIIALLLVPLFLGNAATGEPLFHKPGSLPGAGIASWWRDDLQ